MQKVKFLPYQPHCFAFGGFEVQMLSAFDALKHIDVDVSKMDVWSRSEDFDILHCWGLDLANYENIKWAKKSGKKVVVTALTGYYENIFEKTKFQLSRLIYKERLIKEMTNYIDRFVVLNDLQANIIHRHYHIPFERIHVIPNIVAQDYFSDKNDITTGSKFVLTVGNVCKRKNQLNLAKACINGNFNLVIIGKVIKGEEEYGQLLQETISDYSNISWIRGLKENSSELISYYKNCFMFALPSLIEQQPISLLEAAALSKPSLIANRAYANQKYYKNSLLVNPNSISAIQIGLKEIMDNTKKYMPDLEVISQCKSINVGRAYADVYNQLT